MPSYIKGQGQGKGQGDAVAKQKVDRSGQGEGEMRKTGINEWTSFMDNPLGERYVLGLCKYSLDGGPLVMTTCNF